MTVFRSPEKPISEQPLRIRVRRPRPEAVVVEADGVLDATHEPQFGAVLRHRATCTASVVVLDLTRVSFLDIAGAVAMLEAATGAQVRDKRLHVITAAAVDRLLGLVKMADRFTYAASVAEALAATPKTRPEPLPRPDPPARWSTRSPHDQAQSGTPVREEWNQLTGPATHLLATGRDGTPPVTPSVLSCGVCGRHALDEAAPHEFARSLVDRLVCQVCGSHRRIRTASG